MGCRGYCYRFGSLLWTPLVVFSFSLYYFINGWVMVSSFSNWIKRVSVRVGWWLAVFQMGFNALLLHQWLGSGWHFSNWIESVSMGVEWWLAVFQIGFNALLLYQWLRSGWHFFKLNWQCIYEGWLMVGCLSNGVLCSITLSMVG